MGMSEQKEQRCMCDHKLMLESHGNALSMAYCTDQATE